jgi:hypothetical protein
LLAIVQALWACLGTSFKGDVEDELEVQRDASMHLEKIPWSSLLAKRVLLAVFAVMINYFLVGTMDTTMPAHLEARLGPISIGAVSLIMSLRSVSYILHSFLYTQVMHRNLLSYERMLAFGGFQCVAGLVLMNPLSFVDNFIGENSIAQWFVQMTGILIMSGGLAGLFIPSLPLMQSEVRHLGCQASEQVAQLFIAAMSFGEAAGPILGGALVSRIGFQISTAIFIPFFLMLWVAGVVFYDPLAAAARQDIAESDELLSPGTPAWDWDRQTSAFCDGESAFQWRRLPFALRQKRTIPGSAPSIQWRRPYEKPNIKVPMTAPVSTRRAYDR